MERVDKVEDVGTKNIRIRTETSARLAEEGRFSESFDDVINRLIDEVRALRKKGEGRC